MKPGMASAAVILLLTAASAFAHRLDEFLQATTIALEKDHVTLQMRLTPGVGVAYVVFAGIDADGDGVVSEAEQRAYVERVCRDLTLTMDGRQLRLRLVLSAFPKVEEMKDGLGDIQFKFEADVPRGGPDRRLVFKNHHESALAAYLVNCLVPHDLDIRVVAQDRNFEQSFYQLDYTQAGVQPAPPSSTPGAGSSGK